MTSNIRSIATNTNVDFPIPGVDNDTQGFRDNFNYIVSALNTASDEITSLQIDVNSLINTGIAGTLSQTLSTITESISYLKIASANTNTRISNIETLDISNRLTKLETLSATTSTRISLVEGSITSAQGNINTIQSNITILQGNVTTLQGNVTSLQGNVTSVQGNISTLQNQISSLNSNISTQYRSSAPTSSKGDQGDVKGMVYADSSTIYVCYANYSTGLPDIWAKTSTVGSTW